MYTTVKMDEPCQVLADVMFCQEVTAHTKRFARIICLRQQNLYRFYSFDCFYFSLKRQNFQLVCCTAASSYHHRTASTTTSTTENSILNSFKPFWLIFVRRVFNNIFTLHPCFRYYFKVFHGCFYQMLTDLIFFRHYYSCH